MARRVEELLEDVVKTHVIVSADDVPEQLDWDGSVLLDAAHALHKVYGADAESLYLVRPDGYVGFRSQPATPEPLLEYLGRLFLLDGKGSRHEHRKMETTEIATRWS
jgi:hypothetical protein